MTSPVGPRGWHDFMLLTKDPLGGSVIGVGRDPKQPGPVASQQHEAEPELGGRQHPGAAGPWAYLI